MMTRRHSVLAGIALTVCTMAILGGVATPAPVAALQAPTPAPAPVSVQVDPKTTALLVLDLTSTICQPRATCTATISKVAALLKKARDAGAMIVYSDTPGTSTILSEVAPQAGEPKVTGRADKFFGTNLDDLLKAKGIKTVVITGYVANGAVLYTAFGANIRGYTAVVPLDGTGAEDPFAMTLTTYQLVNAPGFANPKNEALIENRVTLSLSDLVAFVAGAPAPKPAATAQPATTAPSAATAAATAQATQAATAAPTAAASTGSTGATAAKNPFDAIFPAGKGRELALASCGSCHTVVCVAIGQRPVEHWEGIKSNHKAMVTSLNDADYGALFEYLSANFNDKKPEPILPDALKSMGCSTQN